MSVFKTFLSVVCPSTEKGLLFISRINRPRLQMHTSLWSAIHDWTRR